MKSLYSLIEVWLVLEVYAVCDAPDALEAVLVVRVVLPEDQQLFRDLAALAAQVLVLRLKLKVIALVTYLSYLFVEHVIKLALQLDHRQLLRRFATEHYLRHLG